MFYVFEGHFIQLQYVNVTITYIVITDGHSVSGFILTLYKIDIPSINTHTVDFYDNQETEQIIINRSCCICS